MSADAALQFGAEEGPTPVNVFKQIDLHNDVALSREEIPGHGEEAKMMIEEQDNLVEEIFAHEDRDKEDESVLDAKQKIKVKLVDSFWSY